MMPLSALAVAKAKPLDRPVKLVDGQGLYLLIKPTGRRYWRFDYRFDGKRRTLSLGSYPEISLAAARIARETVRTQIAERLDPMATRRAEDFAAKTLRGATFRLVAEEWLTKREREGLAEVTLAKARWLLEIAYPLLGSRPIADIKSLELLTALRLLENRGCYESARRLRSICGRIFRYAIATARAEHDIAANLRDALIVPQVKHLAAITEEHDVGPLLRAIEGYQGHASTVFALRLAPHVFVRPGELRQAEWVEFNLERAVWSIPGKRMKMRRPHRVPLSRQALAILAEAKAISGHRALVFPGFQSWRRPLCENALNGALRRLGYSSEEMTSHGFRAMASTLLNEMGHWHPDAIERQLAHADGDTVRRAYARGEFWEERVRMMQAWSDYLDQLRTGTAHSSLAATRI